MNLMALPTRLMSTWRSRPASPTRASGTSGCMLADQLQPLLVRPHGQGSAGWRRPRPQRKIGRVQFQAAGLDLGEVEDVVDEPSRLSAADLTVCQVLPLVFGRVAVSRASSVMPRMAFIGVRISWLTLARNSSLARFADFSGLLGKTQLLLGPLLAGHVQVQALDEA